MTFCESGLPNEPKQPKVAKVLHCTSKIIPREPQNPQSDRKIPKVDLVPPPPKLNRRDFQVIQSHQNRPARSSPQVTPVPEHTMNSTWFPMRPAPLPSLKGNLRWDPNISLGNLSSPRSSSIAAVWGYIRPPPCRTAREAAVGNSLPLCLLCRFKNNQHHCFPFSRSRCHSSIFHR